MVSDTPSQPTPKKNPEDDSQKTTAEIAGQENSEATGGPAAPKENDDAVKTAMADVAAAIKRHEEHGSKPSDTEDLSAEHEADQDLDKDESADAASDENSPQEPTEDPEKATEVPPPEERAEAASEPQKGKTGFGGLLAAGVTGGVVVLAGGFALQSFGLLGGASTGNLESRFESGMSELRQQINGMASGSSQAASASAAAVSKLQEEVAALQQKLQSVSETASKAAALPSANGTSASTDLQQTVSDLQKQVSSLQSSLQSDTSAVQSLQSSLSGVQSSLSSQANQLNRQISALEKKVDQPGKDLAVARAIAAAGLSSAIDRGGSFSSELKTYRQIAPDDASLQQLDAMAQNGIPTREQLTDQFSGLADTIIRASTQPAADEGVVKRLFNSAKGLISVRPVGDVEGDTTPAIVARIENDLKTGQLQKAADEWANLPDAAKQVSADFEKALNARITADTLIASTLQQAIGSMTGSTSQPAQAN